MRAIKRLARCAAAGVGLALGVTGTLCAADGGALQGARLPGLSWG